MAKPTAPRRPAWRWLRRVLIALALLVGLLAAAVLVLYLVLDQKRPRAEQGAKARAEADVLVARIWRAYDHAAWLRTGAVRWTFRGARQHLWDRRRALVQVRWGDHEVLLRTASKRGRAYQRGKAVSARGRRDALLAKAHRIWVNDAYWLNPLRSLRDAGVTRTMARDEDGRRGLLVRYGAGGVTPGDAYLWFIDDKTSLPSAYRMWVSIIPVGGLEVSWSRYKTLRTGVRLATHHRAGPLSLTLTDVAGAATLGELLAGKPDPFARLAAGADR